VDGSATPIPLSLSLFKTHSLSHSLFSALPVRLELRAVYKWFVV
jgi:hypothetical protein